MANGGRLVEIRMKAVIGFSKINVSPTYVKSSHIFNVKIVDGDIVVLDNVVLEFYANFGFIESAHYVFDDLFVRDRFSFVSNDEHNAHFQFDPGGYVLVEVQLRSDMHYQVLRIPEGLPAVITTCLVLGTRKMAQKNALVRKLPSVKTHGFTTVICSDKTGTLTTNQMAVTKLVAVGLYGHALRSFNVVGTLVSGMPTEAALKVLVKKLGLHDGLETSLPETGGDAQRCCRRWCNIERRIGTFEFDRDRKSMGVIVSSSFRKISIFIKGAVENLLEGSSFIQLLDGSVIELDQNARKAILQSLHEMSSSALRVLGFAYKDDLAEFATYTGDEDHPAHELLLNPSNYSFIESKLVFAGLAGLRDPPRKKVRQAIEGCRIAGIQVMVITEDNKNTVEAICREIGVFEPNEDIVPKA